MKQKKEPHKIAQEWVQYWDEKQKEQHKGQKEREGECKKKQEELEEQTKEREKEVEEQQKLVDEEISKVEIEAQETGSFFFEGKPFPGKPENGVYEYRQGEEKTFMTFKDGKLNGDFSVYQKDVLILKCQYKDGKRDGISYTYHQNKNPHFEAFYQNNILNGSVTCFRENGVKYFNTTMRNNLIDGLYNSFDEFGDNESVVEYKGGERDGKTTNYFPKSKGGKIRETSIYEEGLIIERKIYYETGELFEEMYYDKGKAKMYPRRYGKSGKIL